MSGADSEIATGDRFAFGENWRQFLELVDERRIDSASESMRAFLTVSDLAGKSFIDVGSGSGLSSLVAARLGANVVSFDFDAQSVACTMEMRRRYAPQSETWQIQQGSVLDTDYIDSLGTFDLVYSWGVLHHTGEMWTALDNVARLVAPGGQLFIAIYNDQGRASRNWGRVKRTYNATGPAGRGLIVAVADGYFRWRSHRILRWGYRRLRGIHEAPSAVPRGMDRRRDLVDWVGGWPFQVAKPEEILHFYRTREFSLVNLKTCGGGLGCNEYLFTRNC